MKPKVYRRLLLVLPIAAAVITFCMSTPGAVAEIKPLAIDSADTSTLILLRHAKSDKSNMNIPDIERPLEESGRAEAEEIGNYLASLHIRIDKIFSSPSVRTRQTLEIICKKIGYRFEYVVWDSSLYACTGDHLIEDIKACSDDYKTVMFVGHNPSITDASNALQSNEKIAEVKTCGVVAIDFPGLYQWTEITNGTGILRFYHKPK